MTYNRETSSMLLPRRTLTRNCSRFWRELLRAILTCIDVLAYAGDTYSLAIYKNRFADGRASDAFSLFSLSLALILVSNICHSPTAWGILLQQYLPWFQGENSITPLPTIKSAHDGLNRRKDRHRIFALETRALLKITTQFFLIFTVIFPAT